MHEPFGTTLSSHCSRIAETKSSQSQLSLLLNSFLFSVMHLLELFQDERGEKAPIKVGNSDFFFFLLFAFILAFLQ